MKNILITDGVHSVILNTLIKKGFEVDYRPKSTLDEVLTIVQDYHGIVINSKIRVDRHFLDQASQLEFVARLGSGMEIIDQRATAERNIAVFNSPNGNCNAVAEHAMGMILMWMNHLYRCNTEVKNMLWYREKNRGVELSGKKVGIIGFGHTGSALAQKLSGFEVEVLAYDKYKTDYAEPWPHVTECASLEEVCSQVDVLSFHLPLNPETVHLCNKSLLNKCKRGVLLVNTSRGSVIDTVDLLDALDSNQVGGACLDVFENEKPNTYTSEENERFQYLFSMSNVLVSPHVAGWTAESKYKLAKILLDKILTHYQL
ncbi:NAD(P)-dependent oxidoreductase [Membranihabitans marinus]|uniref:NAD(P)-dependent oxidoreductase n=1 Tax=Membranihabitans marinus TaxID=1227546 RepID=UPI001F014901|nr:NAD(P)-dependent oxidoreductase [Membranihabitans marinus]